MFNRGRTLGPKDVWYRNQRIKARCNRPVTEALADVNAAAAAAAAEMPSAWYRDHEQQIANKRRARNVKMLDALLRWTGHASLDDVEVSTEEVAMARAYCAERGLEATTGIAADWREVREKQLELAKQRRKQLRMCKSCGLKTASFNLLVRSPPRGPVPATPPHRAIATPSCRPPRPATP